MKMTGINQIDAKKVCALLAARHGEDVFVSECKDGPSHSSGHVRLDGWAMSKSWAHPMTWGYEIKVSRADFLQDQKWPHYLTLCNQFYFVCPKGLIEVSEIPNGVGLLYVAKTGNRLFLAKKAEYRDVEIPETLWRYILMARTKIVEPNYYEPDSRQAKIDRWKAYIADKREGRHIGYEVAKSIRERFEEVDRKNQVLSNENEKAKEVLEIMQKLGINVRSWDFKITAEQKLKTALNGVPLELDALLERVSQITTATRTQLSGMRQKVEAIEQGEMI